MSEALGTLLESAMSQHGENKHTAIPGIVVSGGGGKVNVKPSLNRRLKDGSVESLPVIPNVPVWFPRGGGASITWPVKAGDGCLLVFSERSLDEWKGGGGEFTPDDPRRNGLSDAIAFVGLDATGEGSDAIELKMGGVTLEVSGGGVAITGGSVTHNGTNIGDTHTHGGVSSGGSNTAGPN